MQEAKTLHPLGITREIHVNPGKAIKRRSAMADHLAALADTMNVSRTAPAWPG
jgi:hypothetical protein